MIPHSSEYLEALKHWQVDADTGLSSAEVTRRLAEHGANKLRKRRRKAIYSDLQNSLRM